jgi:hypothetical protein
MGCTYCVLAPEHAARLELTTAEQREAVDAYVKASARKSDATARRRQAEDGRPDRRVRDSPHHGAKVPIWVADYVIGGYGTGAVMAVPGTTSATSPSPRPSIWRSSRWSAPRRRLRIAVHDPPRRGAPRSPRAAFVDDGIAGEQR